MNPQELRIAIAQDVLERVVEQDDVEVKTRGYLKRDQGRICQVCAIGGMMLSTFENRRLKKQMADEHRTRELLETAGSFAESFRRLTNSTLGKAFDLDQLGLIEAAFEADYQGCWGNPIFSIDGERIDADDVDTYRSANLLENDQREQFEELSRAVEFGRSFLQDYEREHDQYDPQDNYDPHRALLGAIMQNIVTNEGTFVP